MSTNLRLARLSGCGIRRRGLVAQMSPTAKADSWQLPRDREGAISALFLAHHARLVGLARLVVDDLPSAEDVVQDAFVALYRRWPWMRDRGAALSYLQTSVVNGARSGLRRRRTIRNYRPDPPPVIPSAENQALAHEVRQELVASLATLPTRQRQVLVLRYYLDQTEAEIAHTLSISAGSVKQHASRGLASLAQRLETAR